MQFAFIGDTPYFAHDAGALVEIFTRWHPGLAFALHVGDIKGGHERCSDELLGQRRTLLERSPIPLVTVPGDNEWLDCDRVLAGGYDPAERLQALRRLLHTDSTALDHGRLRIERPGPGSPLRGLPEYQRWVLDGVMFATLNLPGGLRRVERDPRRARLRQIIEPANASWLDETFDRARACGIGPVVIAAHANPGFRHDRPGRASRPVSPSDDDGYLHFRRHLARHVHAHPGAVLFLHGDTHRFRVDQPLFDANGRRVDRLTRVECFGSPFASSWVEIRVRPREADPFFVATRQI